MPVSAQLSTAQYSSVDGRRISEVLVDIKVFIQQLSASSITYIFSQETPGTTTTSKRQGSCDTRTSTSKLISCSMYMVDHGVIMGTALTMGLIVVDIF